MLASEASVVSSDEYIGLLSIEEYNAAVSHVFDLIRASYSLFNSESYAPSVFISITVFEEVAKIKAGYMRSWNSENEKIKRHKDPLFNHVKKHKIAIDPLYLIGNRLAKSIGKKRVEEIFSKYGSGELSSLREKSLYFARNETELHIPSKKISSGLAAEHLLIAIEIFSDEFWGMTAEASETCDKTNEMYDKVESILKS